MLTACGRDSLEVAIGLWIRGGQWVEQLGCDGAVQRGMLWVRMGRSLTE